MKPISIVFSIFFVAVSFCIFAQPGGGDPGGGGPPVPIGGLEILIAAGAALGAKKIYDSSRKTK